MPPLMISVWDAETRLSIAARASAVAAFEKAAASSKGSFHETSETGHDRVEQRRASLVTAPKSATLYSFTKTTPEREITTQTKIFRSSAALFSIY